jgi:4-amino-4-deoxy-L-arabinose transferase-like glycosyltransferase
MLYVSLLVELLRSRPALVFWIATLSQCLLWLTVPALFYPAPPGDVPLVLATGHEWLAGSRLGPPLANWLAEIAFVVSGHRIFGVYLLSQLCVAASFWAIFALARSTVGAQHGAMAVLLMTGIIAFSVPTPEFGPAVLAMPLWALALLHYWRAVGEERRRYWLALGGALGLLLLTTYAGLILIGLLVAVTAATRQGRASVSAIEPWLGGLLTVLIVFPHLMWIDRVGISGSARSVIPELMLLHSGWFGLFGSLIAFHAGALILLLVASGFGDRRPAPRFERPPVAAFARTFVYSLAAAAPAIGTLLAGLFGRSTPVGGLGALVLLSGLAVIMAAGDVVALHRQNVLGRVWVAILLVPALAIAAAAIVLPFIGAIAIPVDRPAHAMGAFFTETFRRRTAEPLRFVVGSAQLAGVVALASPDRPRLFLPDSPQLTPWATEADIRKNGAIFVWPVQGGTAGPPASIQKLFPDLVAEVPQAFERPLQGRLPLYRVGWAMIRPQTAAAPPP